MLVPRPAGEATDGGGCFRDAGSECRVKADSDTAPEDGTPGLRLGVSDKREQRIELINSCAYFRIHVRVLIVCWRIS